MRPLLSMLGSGLVQVLTPMVMVVGVVTSFSWATMYVCTDRLGRSIFTDSPSQLDQCTALPSSQSGPSTRAAGPLEPSPIVTPPKADANAVLVPPDNGPADHGGSAVVVPLTRVGRSLVAQVKVNGQRDARLIVDTGADITVLSQEIARDLGLLWNGSHTSMTLNTVGGSVRADVVRVDSLGVGGAEIRHVPTAIHDLPDAPAGVDGLLGLTFLDKFLVTLDAQKGELLLRPRQ